MRRPTRFGRSLLLPSTAQITDELRLLQARDRITALKMRLDALTIDVPKPPEMKS